MPKKAGGLATVPIESEEDATQMSSSHLERRPMPAYFQSPLLEVPVNDRDRKNSWDSFIRWTNDRRAGFDGDNDDEGGDPFTSQMAIQPERRPRNAYPWASADQEIWDEHGGFCDPLDDDGTATSCSRSTVQVPTPAAARKAALDNQVIKSWGIRA